MEKTDKPVVLVVDDNEPTCTLMAALLHKDFAIDVANDGMEAIEKLRTNSYCAIVLDLLMPHIDGFGVLDFLKANNPDFLRRVVVVTAALTRADVARVRDYNVCALISKPFEVETLTSAVKNCAGDVSTPRGAFLSSGVILLLADLLRARLM